MLELASCFAASGLVLWQAGAAGGGGGGGVQNSFSGPTAAVEALVKEVLLEDRQARSGNRFEKGPFCVRWLAANDFDLVFVVVFQKILQLTYVDSLLQQFKDSFCAHVGRVNPASDFDAELAAKIRLFDDQFSSILRTCEQAARESKEKKMSKGPRSFSETKKAKERTAARMESAQETVEKDSAAAKGSKNGSGKTTTSADVDPVEAARLRFIAKQKGGKKGKNGVPAAASGGAAVTAEPTGKRPKEGRTWDDKAATGREKTDLDRSDGSTMGNVSAVVVDRIDLDQWSSSDDEGDDEKKAPQMKAASTPGRFASLFATLTGNKELNAADVDSVMPAFKEHLMSRNVSSAVAETLCESVRDGLIGRKLTAMTTVRTTFREALEQAVVRVLTPKRSVDILRDALAAKAAKTPYVIVFCGVNGVGKSTNLAKVTSWLQQQGLSILLAACDTFRSGAVEQLEVHAKRLRVPLFERGYRRDPTMIAADAIKEAAQSGIDVVCVDTAGRMQDNEPLMKALSKLVNFNNPNLVLFVGEALVGNDGVDQLVKFNQAMMDHATVSDPRLIDGIILTKFDTIDDKVGAAISMVYTTGIPIVFLGVGQHYTDLRRLNSRAVASALLKGL